MAASAVEVVDFLDRLLDRAIDANSRAFSLRTPAAAELAAISCEELAAEESLAPQDREMWARSARNWRIRLVELRAVAA